MAPPRRGEGDFHHLAAFVPAALTAHVAFGFRGRVGNRFASWRTARRRSATRARACPCPQARSAAYALHGVRPGDACEWRCGTKTLLPERRVTGATPHRRRRAWRSLRRRGSFCKQRGEDNHPRGFHVALSYRAGFFHVGGRRSTDRSWPVANASAASTTLSTWTTPGRSRRDRRLAQLPLCLAGRPQALEKTLDGFSADAMRLGRG